MITLNSRRDFLRLGLRAFSALGAASVVGRLSQVNALAQSGCPTDYRALVCVFLFGGNDGNNTLIPISTPKSNAYNSYAKYAQVRGGLALPQNTVHDINTSLGDGYALHPSLAEIATLYNTKKNVALLANVGTLVNPVTQDQYRKRSVAVPQNLFSHLDQQTEWQSANLQGFATTGWGGRLADAMQNCNTANFPTIITLGNNALFGAGAGTSPATVSAGQIAGLQGFGNPGGQARLAAVKNLLGFDNSFTLVHADNSITSNGVDQADRLNQALAAAKPLKTVFPNSGLGQQLSQVAKIINVRNDLKLKRQIFFTYMGGFDTHDRELIDQASGLQQVSQAISAFYNATLEMGIGQDVVTFTESDFGRTLQPSGGATLGSDHAWGSHHMIVGDAVKGGDIYGQFPSLELGGPNDATGRGVWIPTTALDQYGATLATWFGVDKSKLPVVFPNLANFPAGSQPAFL